jgi:membrane-bound serine protease (ClpP class)
MKARFVPVLLFLCAAAAFSQSRVVTVLTLDGTIDPISARYLLRGLDRARRDGAQLAVIEMNTPGGLGVSMDQIVAGILASPVPVAVYVSPQGARAASAGVFVAMAAHIAAMAPGTHIGAAHPVDSSGADIQGAMGDKVLNDAVASLKSLAVMRGRSETWPDDAVRRSVSLTEKEAVAARVVDLTAPTLGELLADLDGRTVKMPDGPVTLHTAAVEIRNVPMSIIDRVLGVVVNPDLAYIMLVLGILGIIFELTSPGAIAPGVAGAIALLIAFVSFGSLPTNIGGILFIVLAVVLFIVDIKAPTHGFLTAGGVVAFLLGSLLLFPPWRGPVAAAARAVAATKTGAAGAGGTAGQPFAVTVSISPAVIGIMTVLITAFFVFVLGKGIGAQGRKVTFGVETLPGTAGVAVTDLSPAGLVQMSGEQWSAVAEGGAISAGERVEVVGRDGLKLRVRRAAQQGGS